MTEELIREMRAHDQLPEPANARLIREDAGVSQARLARALGVDRATLSRWESGATKPRPARTDAYRKALAVLQAEGPHS